MPTRSGTLYLLDEFSKFPMKTPPSAPMDPQQFTAMLVEKNAKLCIFTTIEERSAKVEATLDQTPPRNNHRDNTDNLPNFDDKLLKSIKMMSPTLMDIITHNFS